MKRGEEEEKKVLKKKRKSRSGRGKSFSED